ncbi:hypothetical protein QZH41_004510 [Actinostola sp. cb2023]|nr:hypothetical protein QZH41_004510 [Actinostola sp. cb2023]
MRSSASKQEQRELPNCVSCQKRLPLAASCPQCGGMICTECVNAHKSMKTLYDEHKAIMFSDFNKEDVNTYIKNQAHCYEKFHQQNKLEYYCQTCHKCICQKCSQTAHTTHYKDLFFYFIAVIISEEIRDVDGNEVDKECNFDVE